MSFDTILNKLESLKKELEESESEKTENELEEKEIEEAEREAELEASIIEKTISKALVKTKILTITIPSEYKGAKKRRVVDNEKVYETVTFGVDREALRAIQSHRVRIYNLLSSVAVKSDLGYIIEINDESLIKSLASEINQHINIIKSIIRHKLPHLAFYENRVARIYELYLPRTTLRVVIAENIEEILLDKKKLKEKIKEGKLKAKTIQKYQKKIEELEKKAKKLQILLNKLNNE